MNKCFSLLALAVALPLLPTLDAKPVPSPTPFKPVTVRADSMYNPLKKYAKGNLVTYNGNSYLALGKIAAGITPTSNTNLWSFFMGGLDNANVAIGYQAGETNQSSNAIALGTFAGQSNQDIYAVAVGPWAGQIIQGYNAVALGLYSGQVHQGVNAVAVGPWAGENSQGSYAVATGTGAGQNTQGNSAVAVGYYAGLNNQGIGALALGLYSGQTNQGGYAVAVGPWAGENNQSGYAFAIGTGAGQNTQGNSAVAVGYYAGVNNQGSNAVALGVGAGEVNQGANAVALGANAGQSNQAANSIVINATGLALDTSASGGFYVEPIRQTSDTYATLYYNSTSGEITYQPNISDKRLKRNIQPVTNALGTVMALNPVTYDLKYKLTDTNYPVKDTGFIAQDLRKVLPDLVKEAPGKEKILSVNLNPLIPILTKAVQQQQGEITALKAAGENQQKEINELRGMVKKLSDSKQ